jgi:hypothetical protein
MACNFLWLTTLNIQDVTFCLTDLSKMEYFWQTTHNSQANDNSFAVVQKATCKHIESDFGVLYAQFAIISNPSRL